MKYIKNTLTKTVLIFLLILILASNIQVLARIKNVTELNIVIEGLENNKEKVDLRVRLYHIKKIVDLEQMKFEVTEDFTKINEIDEKYEEDSEEYVNAVKKYALETNITPTIDVEEKYTNQMTFHNLELGKYLVVIDDFMLDNKKYECNSFIVSIPKKDGKDEDDFNVIANPKISGIEDDKNDTDDTDDSENSEKPEKPTEPNNPDIEKPENNEEIGAITDSDKNYTSNSEKVKLPDTGIPILIILIISLSGLSLIVIGCILDNKK